MKTMGSEEESDATWKNVIFLKLGLTMSDTANQNTVTRKGSAQ